MKSCNSFRELEQFGIMPLTGEADALGFRILCDLTTQGVKVFQTCYGLIQSPPKFTYGELQNEVVGSNPPPGFADNWNSSGVASVMLTGHDIVPLAIVGFYLKGYTVVLTYDEKDHETVYALEQGEDLKWDEEKNCYMLGGMPWPSCYGKVFRFITPPKGPEVRGDRNVHQMTGRAL